MEVQVGKTNLEKFWQSLLQLNGHYGPSISTPGHISNRSMYLFCQDLYKKVHGSFIRNRQKLQIIRVSIKRSELWYLHPMQHHSAITTNNYWCINNMEKSLGFNVEWTKPDTRVHTLRLHLCEVQELIKLIYGDVIKMVRLSMLKIGIPGKRRQHSRMLVVFSFLIQMAVVT